MAPNLLHSKLLPPLQLNRSSTNIFYIIQMSEIIFFTISIQLQWATVDLKILFSFFFPTICTKKILSYRSHIFFMFNMLKRNFG